MSSFFDRMLGRSNKELSSASRAKERLQFVLVHDRINIPPERLQEMKTEILAVISKYVEVAVEKVDISLEQRDRRNNIIVAEIPFLHSVQQSADEAAQNSENYTENQDLDDTLLLEEEDYSTREVILDFSEDLEQDSREDRAQ